MCVWIFFCRTVWLRNFAVCQGHQEAFKLVFGTLKAVLWIFLLFLLQKPIIYVKFVISFFAQFVIIVAV